MITALFSIIIGVAVCFLCFWLRERMSIFTHLVDLVPGPDKKFIVGNMFDFPRDGYELLKLMHVTWVQKYGVVYRMWQGRNPLINISSPPDVETILGNQRNINKSKTAELFLPWLGDGLLLAKEKKWKKDRRLLTPAFHFQILDDFFEVYNRNANIFVEQINLQLANGSEVDVYPMVSRCTLDVISEAAMGIQINAQINSNSEYITAVDRVESLIQERVNSVLGMLPNWLYFLTPHGRTFQRYLDIVHALPLKVLRDRKKQMQQLNDGENTKTDEDNSNQLNQKKRRPFLDLLLEAARQGADLSDEDIIHQVDTFMFEGHDTTAAAITWFLYVMATNPHEQDRVCHELHECFGDSDRPIALEDLSRLKYLDCCIKESMRLYPPVPLIRRSITNETKLGGFTVPVGANVTVQIYALHHNEEYFPEPYAFKPERFHVDQTVGRHAFAFVPFSAGPRNCIGQKFALYEDKVVLITLLRKFRFAIDPSRYPIRATLNVILKPEIGMPLIITPRNLL